MRYLATRTTDWMAQEGVRRLLLVTGIEEGRYRGMAIVYGYSTDEDGPSCTAWLYDDAEHAMSDVEEELNIPRACWHPIPDQMPGCEPDWIAPVRKKRSLEGTPIHREWELWTDGQWVAIAAPKSWAAK